MPAFWSQHRRLDERAQRFKRLRLQRIVLQRYRKLFDLLAIIAVEIEVQQFGLRGLGCVASCSAIRI